jgi:peptidyl-tRNA hydrolase ICT1
MRVSAGKLLSILPRVLHPAIRSSPAYSAKTDSLLFQSDESRAATENRDTCHRKLWGLVDDTFKSVVPGETSIAQKQKVQKLQKAENETRLRIKKKQSSKKSSRSKPSSE